MNSESVFIGLGTNEGRRLDNLYNAFEQIEKLNGVAVANYSSVFETEPVGFCEQDDFLNQVILVSTNLTPKRLLAELQGIETRFGRKRDIKWGPRTIDLDILFWGQEIIKTDKLIVPHVEAHRRRFVLVPLCEIGPNFVTPLNGLSAQALLAACPDTSRVFSFLSREEFADEVHGVRS